MHNQILLLQDLVLANPNSTQPISTPNCDLLKKVQKALEYSKEGLISLLTSVERHVIRSQHYITTYKGGI